MKVMTTVAGALMVMAAVVGGMAGVARGDEERPEGLVVEERVLLDDEDRPLRGATPGGVVPVTSADAVHMHVRCRCPGWTREALLEQLRAARARQVAALRAYLEAGKFPAGLVVVEADEGLRARPSVQERFDVEEPSEELEARDPHAAEGRLHTFIGANGALCAVAHLMAADGQRPLVDRIAKEQNGLCTATTDDPEVLAWIRGSGLTREEVVRIQEPGFSERFRRLVDPQAVIAAHLRTVLAQLEADAEASLATAVERWFTPKA